MRNGKNLFKRVICFVLLMAMVVTMMPNISAKASSGRDAQTIVKDMTVGWNIGNSLDAIGSDNSTQSNETCWGNPTITKQLVEAVGKAGFNTIRIPVSWGQYTSGSDYKISENFLKRVKEVVDYAYDNGMYVILNDHHDISSDHTCYYMPNSANKSRSEKYFKSIWTQIGTYFKDYDDRLVFETMNEPRLVGHSEEWWFPRSNPSNDVKDAISCINSYNQVALDAIRSTGGNNTDRCVMVPGYDASIEGCMTDGFKMPTDSASNRLILSVHAYIPYYFALASDTYVTKFDQSNKSDIDTFFNDLNSKFISKGIPVVVGETSATNRNNSAERVKWADYYWGVAEKYANVSLVLWDNNIYQNNAQGSDGECHRYIDRTSLQWMDPEIITTIMKHVDGTPAGSVQGGSQGSQDKDDQNQGDNQNQGNNQNQDNPNQGGQNQGSQTTATLLNTYGAEYGRMGTCINSWQLKDQTTLDLIKKSYNSVTLENEMKPDAILTNSPSFMTVNQAKAQGYYIPANYKDDKVPVLKFSTIDEVMKICCENNIGLRAHTLVWHSQSPSWFFKTGYNSGNSFVDAATMDARMEMYIKTVMSHVYSNQYGKCVYAWDVVNEYPHANSENWLAVYGKNGNSPEFVKKAFTYANDVIESYSLKGKVSLFFNDYNTYMEVNDVIEIINFINKDKKLCDGVGMQSHLATWYPSAQYFNAALTSFLNAGFEVQITEMDIKSNNSDTEQASYAYDIFKAINTAKKNGGKITGITWWGLSDQVTWIDGQKPLLFSTPTQTKPAYDSVLKAYKEIFGDPKDVTNSEFPTPVVPTATPTPVVTPTPSPTATPTPVVTPTAKPTPVVTPTAEPTPVVTPTAKPTPVVTPTATPTPDVKPSAGLSVDYTINNWGSGYQVLIKVKNTGKDAVNGWTVKVSKKDVTISTSWNVNIKEEGDYYVITPMSWNSTVYGGNSVEFGIQGTGSIGSTVNVSVK